MPHVPIAEMGASLASPSTTTLVPYFADGIVNDQSCVGPRSQFSLPFNTCGFTGGAISTELILVNPTDGALSGTFAFWGQGDADFAASPVNVTIGAQTSSTFSYLVPPRSSLRFSSSIQAAPVWQGSIQISPAAGSQAPFGFGIVSFQLRGTTQYQTTVPGQPPAMASRILLRDGLCCGSTPTFRTSTTLAIANPSASAVAVKMDLLARNGSDTVSVPARGQVVIYPYDLQVGNGYFGLLRISSNSPVSVVGFQKFVFHEQFGSLAVEAFDESTSTAAQPVFIIITVYEPRPPKWISPTRRRSRP